MNTVLKFLRFSFLPVNTDFALFVLRLWIGGSMFFLHGWEKLVKFSDKSSGFPDPFGIGSTASLVLAIFGEVVCSVLIVLGLFTRFAALAGIVTMGVAFFMIHESKLSGTNSGELAFIYLGGYVTLFLAGAGQVGLDAGLGSQTAVKRES